MKKIFGKTHNIQLIDKEIEELIGMLDLLEPEGDDYEKVTDRIEQLSGLREYLKDGKWYEPITDPRVIAALIGIFGLVLVMNYEEENLISTKGWSFIQRMI